MRNIFNELSQVNVNDHVEKKKDLTYLSWAWAEAEIRKRFPLVVFDVIRNPNPVKMPVNFPIYEGTEWVTDSYGKKKEVPKIVEWRVIEVTDDRLWPAPIGATVKTSCTIPWSEEVNGEEKWFQVTTYDELPIMDASNKAIPLGKIDAMSINKTIQRSKTKCIAEQGLGLYIYAGEDLPEENTDEKEQIAIIQRNIVAALKSKEMTKEEKDKFTLEVIIPIIGEANFMKCTSVEKLMKLLDKIKE